MADKPNGRKSKAACDSAKCGKTPKNDEENEKVIRSYNLCPDSECANAHEKNLDDMRQNIATLDDILTNMTGLCKEPACPANENFGKTDANMICPEVSCPYPPPPPCPPAPKQYPGYPAGYAKIAKELEELKSLAGQGICKSPACYNAYMGYYQSDYPRKVCCGSDTCAAGGGGTCGGAYCPFARNRDPSALNTDDGPCGGVPCPLDKEREEPVSLCGRDSCPYAALTESVCGNKTCPYAPKEKCEDKSCLKDLKCDDYECPINKPPTCGGKKCPFATPAEKPYGNDSERKNTCPYGGIPECPFGGTLRTHNYASDKNFVREAARPYSGSASPYDYLGSFDRNYPTALVPNYPLFAYTEPSPIPPCPYKSNQKKKVDCGRPDCENQRKINRADNFCLVNSCPFKIPGICEGPKMYSCNNPDVETCDSPNCKLHNRRASQDQGDDNSGICGGPKMYSCDSPDVEFCFSPTCAVGGGELGPCGAPKMFSCDSPDVEHCQDPECPVHYEAKREACKATTCPYMKKLIFCDDCGGVVPEKDVESAEDHFTTNASPTPENTDSLTEAKAEKMASAKSLNNHRGSIAKERTLSVTKKDRKSKSQLKHEDIKSITTEKESSVGDPCGNVSLYSYPGVQIGHKECQPQRPMIPHNMGWLWNSLPASGCGKVSRWRGYKPGAVSRTVYEIIKQHRRELGLYDSNEALKKKKNKKFKMEDLKHYVEVKKHLGDYTIIVNPVKDPLKTVPFENPFMDVTPIQFKVEKEKKEKVEHECPCDDDLDEKSESDSEFEFKFSPPAAIPDTTVRKVKVKKAVETQYDPKDVPSKGKGGGKGKGGKGKGGKGKKGKKK